MKARHKRFGFIIVGLVGLGLASWLALNALENNLSYFFSPTEVTENKAPKDHVFRLGGLVEPGSLERGKELTVRFRV
ncbi:MAG: cytochrome c maturation protein CcmE, partial [Candidatus Sedimenticola sp. 6PFRAG1]